MAETIMVEATRDGWRVVAGGLALEAEGIHNDRAQMRIVLTVRQGETIFYRDTLNVTGGRARRRVVDGLAEKGVTVDESLLLALDEACRRPRPAPPKNDATPSPFSEAPPIDLAELRT